MRTTADSICKNRSLLASTPTRRMGTSWSGCRAFRWKIPSAAKRRPQNLASKLSACFQSAGQRIDSKFLTLSCCHLLNANGAAALGKTQNAMSAKALARLNSRTVGVITRLNAKPAAAAAILMACATGVMEQERKKYSREWLLAQ